jgi:hypothetical protein
LLQVQRITLPLEDKETHQLALVVTVEGTGPAAVAGLEGLQQVQPLQLPEGTAEKAARF